MRVSNPPIHYLVGTTKARLGRLEASLVEKPFVEAREHLRVKNIAHEGENYIYVESAERVNKERSMRRRALRAYLARLRELAALKRPIGRDEMLVRLGKAQEKAGRQAFIAPLRALRPRTASTPRRAPTPTPMSKALTPP